MAFIRTLFASLAVTASLAGGAALGAAQPEVRGTWLTTTANDAISSPQKTRETMRRLREIGLNVVYVECWKNGYTEFPSQVMKDLIGVEMKINNTPPELQRDLLNETVIEAHRNGMLAIAWFEYGFMAAFRETHNELRDLSLTKGWTALAQDGQEVGKLNPFVWMNPLHPDPQQLVIDIVVEAVRKYDLDGIQLDDRIALPYDLGYDEFTRNLYKKETGRDLPADPKDADFMKWRADKISEYSLRFVRAVRAEHPDLIISVSPAPWPWSYENYLCDWSHWTQWCYCNGQKWTEYVPQVYRMSGEATIRSIDEQVAHMKDEKVNMVAGVRIVGDGPDMPWEGLKMSLEHGRKVGIAGHCHWFSRGVLDVYPEQLKAFYDVANQGHAPHPFKPADWRPMPVVGEKTAAGWKLNVERANKYRVIAKRGDQWSEVERRRFEAGEHVLKIEAEAVELLVDRRPR